MNTRYYSILGRKQKRIKGTPNIDSLLRKGITVSKITTRGQKTTIDTYSPRTFEQSKKQYRSNLPKYMRLPF